MRADRADTWRCRHVQEVFGDRNTTDRDRPTGAYFFYSSFVYVILQDVTFVVKRSIIIDITFFAHM